MTRLVVDTAVLIDAVFHAQVKLPAALLLRIIESGEAILLSSRQVRAEVMALVALHGYEACIQRNRTIPALMRMDKLLMSGEHLDVVPQFSGCADPADDKFVDLAVQGHADYLITEDNHLRSLREPPVPVLTPWELLYRERQDLRPRR